MQLKRELQKDGIEAKCGGTHLLGSRGQPKLHRPCLKEKKEKNKRWQSSQGCVGQLFIKKYYVCYQNLGT